MCFERMRRAPYFPSWARRCARALYAPWTTRVEASRKREKAQRSCLWVAIATEATASPFSFFSSRKAKASRRKQRKFSVDFSRRAGLLCALKVTITTEIAHAIDKANDRGLARRVFFLALDKRKGVFIFLSFNAAKRRRRKRGDGVDKKGEPKGTHRSISVPGSRRYPPPRRERSRRIP